MLTSSTKNKNNPNGEFIQLGVLVSKEQSKLFKKRCEEKCVTKSAVIRKMMSDFIDSGEISIGV